MSSKSLLLKKSVILLTSAVLLVSLYEVVCQAEMMNACVSKLTGKMRMVDDPEKCRRWEKPVSWNNVPQSELDDQKEALGTAKETIVQLEGQLNALSQQLTSLESVKVDQVISRVGNLETEQIPTVIQEISEIQDAHGVTRELVTEVETDVLATSERIAVVNDDLVRTTDILVETSAQIDLVRAEVENGDARIVALEDTAVRTEDLAETTHMVEDIAQNLSVLEEAVNPVVEQLQDLDEVAKLISLAAYITVNEENEVNGDALPKIIFEGINVHIRSGAGSTHDGGIGLGNLIIGYNEGRENLEEGEATKRTGSHNLIIGPYHNYESVGGLVAGCRNTVSGSYATVVGGEGNTASGYAVTVSGGAGYTAAQDYGLMPLDNLVEQ